jgi:hypothetical protein
MVRGRVRRSRGRWWRGGGGGRRGVSAGRGRVEHLRRSAAVRRSRRGRCAPRDGGTRSSLPGRRLRRGGGLGRSRLLCGGPPWCRLLRADGFLRTGSLLRRGLPAGITADTARVFRTIVRTARNTVPVARRPGRGGPPTGWLAPFRIARPAHLLGRTVENVACPALPVGPGHRCFPCLLREPVRTPVRQRSGRRSLRTVPRNPRVPAR